MENLKESREKLMPGACDNTAISLDHLPANIIYHPQPNFQQQLVQSDLKSEINIAYIKLKKTGDN